ncbi:xylose isomerase-like protein [Ephemerocybe angulata]|uniref:Apurinic-apyrimidinic endonuclease 1 n=1 Tax=Ephemerocybe angulata TaxID=980116 RepID=A0A8H6LUG9_9AGAR|nr:xylose isomerase-like protein [Tulosesus angulatus]
MFPSLSRPLWLSFRVSPFPKASRMVTKRRSTASARAMSSAVVVSAEAGPSTRNSEGEVGVESVFNEYAEEYLATPAPKKRKRTSTTKAATPEPDDEHDTQTLLPPEPTAIKRKRTSKKAKEADTTTFLPRVQSPWKVGAHVSAAGGVENAVLNAAAIGANAFALFLKSQRKWEGPPLSASSIRLFKERMKEYGYESKHVLPHGNYLINLGNPDAAKRAKSYECFVDDLRRCEALGLKYYNFHPGPTVGNATPEESIQHIANSLNAAHKEAEGIVTVLENMAGAGNVIGSSFKQIAAIIALVEDKSRVGVCVDTCHAHAAGYDVTGEGWEDTLKRFEEEIGLKYLCGMHLNDSKTECGSRRDPRHENIGMGTLGLPAFHAILTDERTKDIPLILETVSFERPTEVWGVEIGVLNALSELGQPPVAGVLEKEENNGEGDLEREMEALGGRVREVVGRISKEVEKVKKAKGVKVKGVKTKGVKAKGVRGVKRKKTSEVDEEGDDEAD